MKLLWSKVEKLDLPALARLLRQRAKRVGDVTLADLVAPEPRASNGLYVFFTNNSVAYVGCARSRALIERVPAHLDSRETGWFGTLLKKLANERGPGVKRSDVVQDALDSTLAVIFKDVRAGDIETAERALRHALAPRLNSPKRPQALVGTLERLSRKGTW